MGVGPGDEVVVPSFTFYASAEAIPPTGARPVFCDIDPDTFCVTADTVRAALTPRTKAVIAVHLFGNVAPVAEIEALGRARARGRRAGRRLASDAGRPARSARPPLQFFPSKNLGCFGDGGAITTSDAALADACGCCASTARATRSPTSRSATTRASTSCRPRSCACSCPISTRGRTAAARAGALYAEPGLGELVALPRPVAGSQPAWHLYVVAHPDAPAHWKPRSPARASATAYYRTPIHRQPAMRAYGDGVELPATDHAARTHLAIPMSPVLSAAQADEVVGVVRGLPL